MSRLGKILFPKTSHDVRRREMRILLWVIITAVILSVVLAFIFYHANANHPK